MKLLTRNRARTAPAPAAPSFGAWVLRQFLRDRDLSTLTFADLERLCASAGSILCGAAHADPDSARARFDGTAATRDEAALLARRTADGFRAALADRDHVVVAWPWDHLATRLAWLAQQRGETDIEHLGRDLEAVASAYAACHPGQLAQVIALWRDVASTVAGGTDGRGLDEMGETMERAFRAMSTEF